jgi:hypothetical protein
MQLLPRLVCITALTGHAAAACPTCVGPTWSWATFPAFFHSSQHLTPANDGGFSEEALDVIAKFPMVTIEKWQGDKVAPPIFEEQAWPVAAKQIKARNPKATVVVWLDSFRIYTADPKLNPDLGPSCTTGHFRPAEYLESGGRMDGMLDPASPYLLKNASGQPALESWSKCHIFDHTQAAARDYWTAMCLNLTRTGVIDGCGADASWQNGVDQAALWGLAPDTAARWDVGHKQMMRQTTAALGAGVLLGKDPWEVGDYVNGALHEGCAAENATILTLQNLTARAASLGARLIYQCHGTGDPNEMAAFLVGAGEHHYYGLGGWNSATGNFSGHRPAAFDRPLGAPKAAGAYDAATGSWSREFAGGVRATFHAASKTGSIAWPAAAPPPQRALKADDSDAKKAKSSRTKMSDKARKKAKEMHEKKHGKKEPPPIMEL